MDSKKEWTIARSIELVVIILVLIGLAALLIINYDLYPAVSKVVAGIWLAIMTVSYALGLRRSEEISLVQILTLRPFRYIMYTNTGLFVIGVSLYLFYELGEYQLVVQAANSVGSSDIEISGPNYVKNFKNEPLPFRAPPLKWGNYTLLLAPNSVGLISAKKRISVGPFDRNPMNVEVKFPRKNAKLVINTDTENLQLTIVKVENDMLYQGTVSNFGLQYEETGVEPGFYRINASAVGHVEDERNIELVAGITKTLQFKLSITTGELKIKPSVAGMVIYIDDKKINFKTPHTVKLALGRHTIVLTKKGTDEEYGFYHATDITITGNNVSKSIIPNLRQKELPKIRVVPSESEGNTIYFLKNNYDSVELSLGSITRAKDFPVFPGEYTLSRRETTGKSTERKVSVSDFGEATPIHL